MIRLSLRMGLAALAMLPASAIVACSTDGDVGEVTEDGGGIIGSNDASADTAQGDSAPDARSDAAVVYGNCSADHFCHSELPKGQNLRGIWVDENGVAWGTSVEGDVLRWDGTAWSVHQHLTDEGGIFSIYGFGPTDIWIATTVGLLHGTGADSASIVFEAVTLPGDDTVPIKSVWGTSSNDFWAVGGFENYEAPFNIGRVVHYTSQSGFTLDSDIDALSVSLEWAWGSADSGVWAFGKSSDEFGAPYGVVVRREAGADAWHLVELPVDPKTPDRRGPEWFMGGAMGGSDSVWLSGYAGGAEFPPATWQGSKVGNADFAWTYSRKQTWDRSITGFWGTSPNDMWSVGQSGLVAHWDGTAWKQAVTRISDSPVPNYFWAIYGTRSDDFWVVGDAIALHRTNADKP